MPAGRPTSYTQELLDAAHAYVDGRYDDDPETGEPVPTVAGLSLYIGVSRDTVYDWIKQDDKVEFSDIVSRLMAKQEMGLLRGGIFGNFNASITKLALTKHGYTDKQDSTHTGLVNVVIDGKDAQV